MEPQEFQNLIFQAINSDDSAAAIQVLVAHKNDPSLELPQNVELQMKYIRMMSLTGEQLVSLMKQSVLAAYSIPEFDLVEKIKTYLTQMDDTFGEINLIRSIITILENSEEILGKGTIEMKEGPAKPTIKNWIEDYLSLSTLENEKNAFTELQYINTSQNAKALTTVQEKEILKNILKLIDYCIDINDLWESEPTPKTEADAYPDFDLYKFIPGVREYLEDEDIPQTEAPQQPQMPHFAEDLPTGHYVDGLKPEYTAPKFSHIAKDLPNNQYIDEISRPEPQEPKLAGQLSGQQPPVNKSSTLQGLAKPAPVLNQISGNRSAMPANDQAKIRELLNNKSAADISELIKKATPVQKPGVVKDDTNISLKDEKERLEKARTEQIDSIAQKLEDLRNRQKQKQ